MSAAPHVPLWRWTVVYIARMNTPRLILTVGVAVLTFQVTAFVRQADEAVWREFMAWAATVPATTFVGDGTRPAPANALDLYRTKLRNDGVPDARIGELVQELRERMEGFGTAEWSRLVYNNNYAPGVVKVYTEAPNAFVAEVARSRTPGTALDVAMGQGRNAIFLAQQGWQVTGFDVSDQGLAIAAQGAKRFGVSLDLVRASNAEFDWGTDRWDMIVITYSPYEGPIERALKRGGVLVIETFLWDPEEPGTAPKPPTSIGPNELLTLFPSLRVLRYEDITATSDWGGRQTRIVRLLAQKPLESR